MREVSLRLVVGLVAVLLVTAGLAGTVIASGAISQELSDGDQCETGGQPTDVPKTVTPENVTSLAGNVTSCIADGANGEGPPTGGG